jgi:hypothetical protein
MRRNRGPRIAATETAFACGGRMIRELLTYPQVDHLRRGEVAEFHQDCYGSIGFIHTQSIDGFLEDWGYALLDRSWNETVYKSELPAADPRSAYVGVVHDDGAFLVELNSMGVRQ